MLSIGIARIESAFERHLVVVIIRHPLTHLLVVAVLALRAHVADLLGPFAVFHTVEIRPIDDDIAFRIVFLVRSVRLAFIELFFNLFLSVVIVPRPRTMRLTFSVITYLLHLPVLIIELPFS